MNVYRREEHNISHVGKSERDREIERERERERERWSVSVYSACLTVVSLPG